MKYNLVKYHNLEINQEVEKKYFKESFTTNLHTLITFAYPLNFSIKIHKEFDITLPTFFQVLSLGIYMAEDLLDQCCLDLCVILLKNKHKICKI